jgi:hypothetical protein
VVDCQIQGIKKLWATQEKLSTSDLRSLSRLHINESALEADNSFIK